MIERAGRSRPLTEPERGAGFVASGREAAPVRRAAARGRRWGSRCLAAEYTTWRSPSASEARFGVIIASTNIVDIEHREAEQLRPRRISGIFADGPPGEHGVDVRLDRLIRYTLSSAEISPSAGVCIAMCRRHVHMAMVRMRGSPGEDIRVCPTAHTACRSRTRPLASSTCPRGKVPNKATTSCGGCLIRKVGRTRGFDRSEGRSRTRRGMRAPAPAHTDRASSASAMHLMRADRAPLNIRWCSRATSRSTRGNGRSRSGRTACT